MANPAFRTAAPPPPAGTSPIALLHDLARTSWRGTLIGATVLGGIAFVSTMLRPRQYEATMGFVPSSGQQVSLGAASGLASQFGLQVGGGSEGVAYYTALVRSRAVLGPLASAPAPAGGGANRPLMDVLGIPAASPGERAQSALETLRQMVTVQTNMPANLVVVKVRTKVPALSEAIAALIFTRLNDINTQRRRTQAAAELQFAEERTGGANADLERAESELANFQLRNRSYTGSPELALQHERLRRRVEIRQQVFSTLLQNRERARIEETRDTPVITLIDPPDGSAVKVPRGTVLNTLVGLAFGAFLGLGLSRLRRTA